MLLGLHTYSFYLHGIGQAWADFKLPWRWRVIPLNPPEADKKREAA